MKKVNFRPLKLKENPFNVLDRIAIREYWNIDAYNEGADILFVVGYYTDELTDKAPSLKGLLTPKYHFNNPKGYGYILRVCRFYMGLKHVDAKFHSYYEYCNLKTPHENLYHEDNILHYLLDTLKTTEYPAWSVDNVGIDYLESLEKLGIVLYAKILNKTMTYSLPF